ncbi:MULTISPECIES: helix-turn-helix domain-containing protein [Bacillus cereus group]|uniref:AraC family transcriptional regulator n=1 Tax=Bacillus cereus TaxID=1396 RepID=A0A2B8SXY8_BACCE|nr:helix-turn-helix domain-containing protein [Bacillus cereus]PDY82847.1 AraC family transcriptional regulator [Bacillus cereus]PFA02111.1 AraC family transcriptional regulator [Bacillus cereus]PFM37976.1 AraC family transcriptional regulator [Bacillus cereus]PGL57973.1 AraC family transcriptional regulator [Bacillus cereus]PGQ07380.1 AraC family transcriptional regulator [Bacillus cereus]
MNCSKLEDLYYICKLVFDIHKTPIFFIDNKGDLAFEISPNFQHNPLYSSKEDLLNQLFKENPPYTFPVLEETSFLENFFSISLRLNDQLSGNIIVGPVLYSRLSETSIKGIVNDLQLKVDNEKIIRYYHSLPILSNLNFLNVSMVLYYMLYQQKLDVADILQKNILLKKDDFEIEQPDIQISEQRQSTLTHIDPLIEREIFECIKLGKKDDLIKNLRRLPESGDLGVLSKTSHLRSQKNSAIAAITLATRSAIDGGLFPEIAYTLSDLFIQKLEEINKSEAISPFLENALLEFSERVRNGTIQKHSKPINVCQNYIFTHLYEEITLSQLAGIVALNPSYLSSLFKKEIGISLGEYIQRAKIDESKNLMTFTRHSISEISTLLNFHDQSHFTKVFKKHTGVSPKQFKNGCF